HRAAPDLASFPTRRSSDLQPLIADARFRDRIAQVEMELMALEITCHRVLWAESQNRAPGPEASLLKIRGTEIQQTLSELAMQAVGPAALDFGQGSAALYCNLRKTSIYGGSNEIQKNIISQMILGL